MITVTVCVRLFQININGYSRIFGIFDAVDILVSGKTTQIKMVAEIHKSIYAHVYLTSNYSQNRNQTHLEAKIIFRNELSKVRPSKTTDWIVLTLDWMPLIVYPNYSLILPSHSLLAWPPNKLSTCLKTKCPKSRQQRRKSHNAQKNVSNRQRNNA